MKFSFIMTSFRWLFFATMERTSRDWISRLSWRHTDGNALQL